MGGNTKQYGPAKKRAKTVLLLDVVTKYNFLLLGLLCHIFVMLLLSLSAEFSQLIGSRYQTLIDTCAVVGIIVLGVVLLLRWTAPMCAEEALIILLLWILISSRIDSTHCFCCGGSGSATADADPDHGGLRLHDEGDVGAGEPVAHHVQEAGGLITPREAPPPDDFVLAAWRTVFHDCQQQTFNIAYSLLAVAMLIVGFFTELKNYWVSLAFRFATVVFICIVVLLLIISPSLCSKFSIGVGMQDSFIVFLRVTGYEILWFLNRYKRVTERALEAEYSAALQLVTTWFNETKLAARKRELGPPPSTPRQVMREMSRFFDYLADKYNARQERRQRKQQRNRSRRSRRREASLSESEESESGSDEEQTRRSIAPNILGGGGGGGEREDTAGVEEETMFTIIKSMSLLVQLNGDDDRSGQFTSWFSWRYREYHKQILHIIDLAVTAWILVVCQWWMLFALPELVWLYWAVSHNRKEIYATEKYVSFLREYLTAQRGKFEVYIT
jgi:hypothetical protein